jgi:hypothetical protein
MWGANEAASPCRKNLSWTSALPYVLQFFRL